MEDRRKINQQHKHKDKQRNAKPSAKSASTTQQPSPSNRNYLPDDSSTDSHFAKRTLTSNWGKYELAPLDGDDENQQLSAADFQMLLLAPKSVGSHFVFSNEKNWNTDTEEAVAVVGDQTLHGGQHFRFNLAEFEQQMATIPFYKRQDYGADLFSPQEIEDMNRCAKLAPRPNQSTTVSEGKYEIHSDAIKLLSALKGENTNKAVTVELSTENANPPNATAEETEHAVTDELDALLDLAITEPAFSVTFPSVNLTNPNTSSAEPANDIQKWLDDILDD